jgi:rare lipoprotein A (peptidoglycan hydrolase)
VNDWGPDRSVHPDRVIDLDSVAFKKLASLGAGVIDVRVQLLQ